VTWATGISGFPSGAVGAADVRLTIRCADGDRYIEGLQKVWPVASHAAVAFAGSVAMGIHAVRTASRRWQRLPSNRVAEPTEIAERLAASMRRAWPRFDPENRTAGCELLVIGWVPEDLVWYRMIPSPTSEPFYMNDPSAPPARTKVFTLCGPEFTLVEAPSQTIASIGSGAKVAEWRDEVMRFLHTSTGLDDREISLRLPGLRIPVIASEMLREAIASSMELAEEQTVSRYMQRVAVGPGGVSIGDAKPPPAIARTWKQYVELLRRHGYAPSAASA
jgi:hypothetical protein